MRDGNVPLRTAATGEEEAAVLCAHRVCSGVAGVSHENASGQREGIATE
jgi:hypothetical protein